LYLALTVLEKLEYVYSNSWIASREYEKALELALRQCNKCHELVKAKVGFLSSLDNHSVVDYGIALRTGYLAAKQDNFLQSYLLTYF